MCKGRPADGKFGTFKSSGRNFYAVIVMGQKTDPGSEPHGDVKRAGGQVAQRIIKCADIQRAPHIDSAGRRCLDRFFFKNALEFIRHKTKRFIGSIGCLFFGILANRIQLLASSTKCFGRNILTNSTN
jgi:hypothetical protein